MPGDLPPQPTNTTNLAADAGLGEVVRGTLMFNATRGRLTSIDRTARSLLGWPETETGAGLDAAMPALVRLRALVRSGALKSGPHDENLLFWSRRGAQRLPCRIQYETDNHSAELIRIEITAPAHGTASPPEAPMSPIELRPGQKPATNGHAGDRQRDVLAKTETDPAAPVMSPAKSASSPAVDDEPDNPPRLSDDAATMREIGQRIRNGIRSSAEVAELTAANDRTALPDYLVPPDAAMKSRQTVVETASESGPARSLTEAELAQILSRTAHEIKTPLGAIAAASEVMRDEHLGPASDGQYRAYAAGIHANARHALDIVDRLLKAPLATEALPNTSTAAPKVPFGPPQVLAVVPTKPVRVTVDAEPLALKPLTPAVLDLNTLTEAVVRDLQALADKAGVRLTAVTDANVGYQVSDATALKQALINLVTNALKFTSDGGAVSIETEVRENNFVALNVRDTGRGMTRAMAARLIDPALNPNPRRKTETGHGLGFQQIRAFAVSHNAEILIDSTLGKGTCVTLLFGQT